jgi:protein-L-isoaspartate(D-aspartate) O-methyltransferase
MKKQKTALILILTLLFLGFSSPPSVEETSEMARQKGLMINNHLKGREIKDREVLRAMEKIPRHYFVPESQRKRAYKDHPLPIGEGQTISQPYVVALMTEALKLKPGDKVLEIGTGSGYQAAVLGEIVQKVYTIEIREPLAIEAEKLLQKLGYKNIMVQYADGYYGWEDHAPFDAIIITASANHIPPPLIKQLTEGGRLIIPLGSTLYYQTLTLITKKEGKLEVEQMGGVAFVPMMGEVRKKR